MKSAEDVAKAFYCAWLNPSWFSRPPSVEIWINTLAPYLAAYAEEVARERVKEAEIDRIRLQQEINCLRMPPCQLPHCVESVTKARSEGYAEGIEDAANKIRSFGIGPSIDSIVMAIRDLGNKR